MYKLEHDTWMDFEEVLEGRKLFLFGGSTTGKGFIKCKKYPVTGFIANDFEKLGKEIQGIPVWSIEELESVNPQEVVVLITSVHFKEKIRRLRELGISNFFVKSYLDENEELQDSEDTF